MLAGGFAASVAYCPSVFGCGVGLGAVDGCSVVAASSLVVPAFALPGFACVFDCPPGCFVDGPGVYVEVLVADEVSVAVLP